MKYWQVVNQNIKDLGLTPTQLQAATGRSKQFITGCLGEGRSWTLQDLERISEHTATPIENILKPDPNHAATEDETT